MLDHPIESERTDHPNLAIDGRVVQGDPANVLESASLGAALFVVAQHGELVGLLLGSVMSTESPMPTVQCLCVAMTTVASTARSS